MGDLNNNVGTSTLDIVDIQQNIKDAEYTIKKLQVKPINVALNYVTKNPQRIADKETPTTFRQDLFIYQSVIRQKSPAAHHGEGC